MSVECTGVILAGGRSTRYGGLPKGLVEVGGRRVIDRVVDALANATDDLLLIANDPAAGDWLPGVRVEPDVRIGEGSLGGIHAAVVRAGRPVLVVAWDMPFVPGALLQELRALGADADAAVPESGSRRGVEPLCAYYTPACAKPIERRLDVGDRRVIGFYDDVRVARLDAAAVGRYGDPAILFMNINTADDLTIAEQYASATTGRHHRKEA
jgi:molybdopterin-guanine dinucleotide biosynthesis protein A